MRSAAATAGGWLVKAVSGKVQLLVLAFGKLVCLFHQMVQTACGTSHEDWRLRVHLVGVCSTHL
jgi:hypothetical protein